MATAWRLSLFIYYQEEAKAKQQQAQRGGAGVRTR